MSAQSAIEVKKRRDGEFQRPYSFVSEECFESVAKSPKNRCYLRNEATPG